MAKNVVNAETVSGEALFILKNLKENGRLGRSNKLADVKAALEPSVSLEFDSYFFFLRKFQYVAMDREAQLKLTDQGERVVEGDGREKFSNEIGEFFADQIQGGEELTGTGVEGETEVHVSPPPPPADVLLEEAEVYLPAAAATAAPSAGPSRRPEAGLPRIGGAVGVLSSAPGLGVVQANGSAEPRPLPFMPPSVPAPPAVGKATELDARYQKFDAIGGGPLATVFKGRFNALGLEVCIKELKDLFGYFSFLQRGEVIKRLKRELCGQAQVRHPGVVQVLDQSTEVARPYFVVELLKGSLKDRLEDAGGKGLPVSIAVRAFLQMAYGLRAAHEAGLTHHNLKPENVLFDACGNAKLADFGLGRVIEVDAAKGMPQVFMGTGGMAYMAPEVMARAKEIGPAADVYGLGILLYEMITGQIPGRRSPLPSEVNPECPPGLDPLFDRMTQDKKEQRYPDLDAVLDDFYKAFPGAEYLRKGDLILSAQAG